MEILLSHGFDNNNNLHQSVLQLLYYHHTHCVTTTAIPIGPQQLTHMHV